MREVRESIERTCHVVLPARARSPYVSRLCSAGAVMLLILRGGGMDRRTVLVPVATE